LTIKAIPTVYDDYRFHSRLEAKWAVFFNAANVRYQYELQGYDLPSGWYLPDFWLPDYTAFLEVKPLLPTLGPEQVQARQLVEMTGVRTTVVYDDPVGAFKNGHAGIVAFYPSGDLPFVLDIPEKDGAAIRARQHRFERR
jgi:hypothetical protein